MKSPSRKSGEDPPSKPRRSKSREISSRFLSPPSPSSAVSSPLPPPPDPSISPIRPKHRSSSKHCTAGSDDISLLRGLWPSSAKKSNPGTLADHLGNDRLIDFFERSKPAPQAQNLNRQPSCSEFARSEKHHSKENRPIGGSLRFTRKLRFPGKSAPSPPHPSSLTPERFSVDANALDQRPSRRRSDTFSEIPSSESERSDLSSSGRSRRSAGIEVAARFLQDPGGRSRRTESVNPQSSSSSSPVMKRSNTVTGYGSAATQWALSPGRAGKAKAFSGLRPRSPTRKEGGAGKVGMGSLLSMGLDLFKGKRSSSSVLSSSSSPSSSSPSGGVDGGVVVHDLRLLQNRVLQWRFVNAKAEAVNAGRVAKAQITLLNAWATLSQLQSTVVQKRIKLEKEKILLKVNKVVSSQIKPLESWGEMERQHHSAVSTTKDSLHAVVCRVPLIEGAEGDTQPFSIVLRHATDLTASIKAMTTDFSPVAQKAAPLLSELAEVVSREKILLQECFELLRIVENLELQERSLRCQLIQLKSQQQQQQLRV